MFTEGEEMYLTGKQIGPPVRHSDPLRTGKEIQSPFISVLSCFGLILRFAINSPLSGWFGKVAGVANMK